MDTKLHNGMLKYIHCMIPDDGINNGNDFAVNFQLSDQQINSTFNQYSKKSLTLKKLAQ